MEPWKRAVVLDRAKRRALRWAIVGLALLGLLGWIYPWWKWGKWPLVTTQRTSGVSEQ